MNLLAIGCSYRTTPVQVRERLAFDGDTIYVGESANRGRDDEVASLVVIEGDQIRERIPLPCAEIFDLEIVPAALVSVKVTG